ncbi:pectin lyase fold/virulence factor [Aspergillus pseudotamarii]|uniref:Pectin lyase fold/virulence factor n=1 Tax=Aspergillus pseudotamarii TaxID=132259 RepID=A0A5N6SZS7_ASPPS|nr:pectin lyase fold/virulence factor [Aspergillus pseudotamarii]KAE8140145.1 pectin lyase fold/virulence factor [Aspergillus pseudotamarii]
MQLGHAKIFLFLLTLSTPVLSRRIGHKHTHVAERQAPACTPTAGGSPTVDDVPAIESAMAACPAGTILIPPKSTYHINSELSFAKCAGCTLQVEGTLLVSDDTKAWSGKDAILNLEDVNDVSIVSKTGAGVIDGNGQAAWDLLNKDKNYSRVKCLLYLTGKTSGVTVSGLTMRDPPNVFSSVKQSVTNVTYTDLILTAVSKSDALAKNTDGFDLGGTGIRMENIKVENGDDCIAIQNGAEDITVNNIQCTGSHGLSIGSIGKTAGEVDTVKNIHFKNAKMTKCSKAAGIKIYSGGYGTAEVSNVTWENVMVDGTSYAFQVQSCYGSDEKECASQPSTAKLTDIVVKGFSGKTDKDEPVASINCPAKGTCGLSLTDMKVQSANGREEYQCSNAGSIGVKCVPGASG